MLKRGFVFLFAFLLVVSLVSAAIFDVSEEDIKSTVRPDEQAVFNLVINNYQDRDDTFRISSPDVSWNLQSAPLYHYFSGVAVSANNHMTTTLMLSPPSDVRYGQYKVEVNVKSVNTGLVSNLFLYINVRSPVPLIRDYFAAVSKIVDFDTKVNPSGKLVIDINLENKNPKNITNLVVDLSCKLFSRQITTSLGPWEKKTLQAEIMLDPTTKPQDDVLDTTLYVNGQKLDPVLKEQFKIIGYSDIKVEKRPVEKSFLQTVETTLYYNSGNTVGQKIVEQEVGLVGKLFLKSSPEPSMISKAGRRYMAWELSLGPQEKLAVKVVRSYRFLFGLFVAAVVCVMLYYLFRSPVVVKKEAVIIGMTEGGISDLKVIVHIKNRSKKIFENVVLVDKLPHITRIEEDFGEGSLKPSSIVQKKEGTVIKWNFDSLDKFEERVLSYRIKSKLSILGAFTLPRAMLKFSDGQVQMVTRSNKVRVKEEV